MSAIGILGGMGPQASTKLLELLIEGTKQFTAAANDEDFPEIVLLNVPVPNFISNKNNLPKVKQMLIERTKLLEQAGCSIIGIACNTAHILLPELQAVTKVPFLAIPDLVARRVKNIGFKRVGLLGTPTTLSSNLFDDSLANVAVLVRPSAETAKKVEKLIFKQLADKIVESDTLEFRKMVGNFKKTQNLDAVILGCTELPLIFGKTNDPRIIDTLEVLSDGLLEFHFSGSGSS